MKNLIAFALFSLHLASAQASPQSLRLKKEFHDLYALVQTLKPEFVVGGYLNGKSYGDHELLWHLAEEPGGTDTIRVYREKGPSELAVSYIRSTQILEGRTVLRRTVGPVVTGWRNDTVDWTTDEYLGSQGVTRPELDSRDQKILRKWGVRLFASP